MKDLFKTKSKSPAKTDKKSTLPTSSKGEVAAFLDQVAKMPAQSGDARLVFALDATASRQPTWDIATELQADMFKTAGSLGGLSLQLCYFRGLGEFFSSDWHSSGKELLPIMTGIQCQAGATQLAKVLRHALKENEKRRIKGLVFIGDAMEENLDLLAQTAGKLGLLNVPLFMFQERGDPATRAAFMELCRLSGGAYSQFDAASAAQLRELLQAVAIYAAGGIKALSNYSKRSDQNVKLLTQQLKS